MNINPSKLEKLEFCSMDELGQIISFYLDEKIFAPAALSVIHNVDKIGMRTEIVDVIAKVLMLTNEQDLERIIGKRDVNDTFSVRLAKALKKDYEEKRKEKIQG